MMLIFSVLAGAALLIALAFGLWAVMLLIDVKPQSTPSSVGSTFAPSAKRRKFRS